MKRPMTVIGIAFLAAQLAAVACGYVISAVLCAAVIALIAASFRLLDDKHRRIILPVLVSCTLAFGIFAVYAGAKTEPAKELYGKTIHISGEIVQQPHTANGRSYYVVDADNVDGEEVRKIRIRISSAVPLDAEISDIFTGVVTVNIPNRDGFSYRAGMLSRGIFLTAYVHYSAEPEITEVRHGAGYAISFIRRSIDSRINMLFDHDSGAMLKGVLLGNKSEIDDALLSDFRACGLSHLLAVSGLHLTMLVSALDALLKRLNISYRPLAAIMIVFIWFYAALTGFSFSVLRASFMFSIMMLARVLNREGDSLSAFGSALFFICLFNPFAAADAGLLLSASATFGLIVFSKWLNSRISSLIIKRCGKAAGILLMLTSVMLPSIVATLSTLPVAMIYFGEFSIIAPIANLLCVRLSSWFMIAGAVTVIISYIPVIGGLIAAVSSTAAWLFCSVVRFIVQLLGALPHASVMTNFRFLPVFFVCAAVIAAICCFARKSYGTGVVVRRCAALLVLLFAVGITTESLSRLDDRYVTVYCVENGVAVAAVSGYSCAVVGTGGDRYDVWQMTQNMKDNNFSTADVLVYPSADGAYTSYAGDFNQSIFAEQIYVPSNLAPSDDLAYALRDAGGRINNVADLNFSSGRLEVNSFTDSDGLVWIEIINGSISTIVCPAGGNCAGLPINMRYPWCAVIMSDDIVNLSALDPATIVVSADESTCAEAAARLRYRGFEHVYTTSHGNITITEKDSGMLIGGE